MSDLGFEHRFVPGDAAIGVSRVLLLLHGTGGDENDLLHLGRAIDANAALLSPRGKVLEHGSPRFFRRLAEGVFDEEDVIARSHELATFIDAAAAQYKLDIGQIVAVGYSNGANIAAAMVLLGVARFSKAIFFRAMVPLTPPPPPRNHRAKILLSEGRFDPIATPENGKELETLLGSTGAEVDLVFQSSGHELTEDDVAAAQQWLTSLA